MKYIVEIPWSGVDKGQVVEFEKLHPALKPNVKPLSEELSGNLTPATPDATSDKLNIDLEDKEQVKAKLKELSIEFDGRSGLDDLVALLPK